MEKHQNAGEIARLTHDHVIPFILHPNTPAESRDTSGEGEGRDMEDEGGGREGGDRDRGERHNWTVKSTRR